VNESRFPDVQVDPKFPDKLLINGRAASFQPSGRIFKVVKGPNAPGHKCIECGRFDENVMFFGGALLGGLLGFTLGRGTS